MSNLLQAIDAWKRAFGPERVLTQEDHLKRYKIDTGGTVREIPASVFAYTNDDVISIVKIASQYSVPLYPISKGNNWGYGSANPARNGSVIVDLSMMTRISDFDEDLGIVSVEPGVTQRLLHEFLREKKDLFLTPTTGAGPEGSILGNALERGYGLTPISDHFLSLLSLEAVLPDGSLYHSAIYDSHCETSDKVFKWGIGPYLDGLFSQGNFGIVTKITIQLAPRPEKVGAFIFEMREEADLEKAVTLIKETLRELGGVTGSINLMNSLRVLSMSEPYPYEQIKNSPGDFVNILKRMNEKLNFAPWTCLGSFYGKKEIVQAATQLLKERIYPHTRRLIFLSRAQLAFLESIVSWLPASIARSSLLKINRMKMSFDMLEGRPNYLALPLAYRKLPGGIPNPQDLNPARDGCGLIWYAPLVPMKPSLVRKYVDFVYETCIKYRIEPLITLTSLSDRCFDSTVPLLFNAQDPEEAKLAHDCLDELFTKGRTLGFHPYRSSIDMMPQIINLNQPFWAMQKKLKDALDPKGIIAPGRYSAI